eukprot:7689840-Prorocentrum_lima.AAC.1
MTTEIMANPSGLARKERRVTSPKENLRASILGLGAHPTGLGYSSSKGKPPVTRDTHYNQTTPYEAKTTYR